MNAFVADDRHFSPSLLLQQAKKLADTAGKMDDHGKEVVGVSEVLCSSANDGEFVTKIFVVPVLKFLSDVKKLKYTFLF